MRSTLFIGPAVAAAILTGCGFSKFSDPPMSKELAEKKNREHDTRFYDPSHPLSDASGYVDASSYAEQVGAALDRSTRPGTEESVSFPANPNREIIWLDTNAFPAGVAEADTEPVIDTNVAETQTASTNAEPTPLGDDYSPVSMHGIRGDASAFVAMVKELRQRDDPALNRALAAAAVSIADPQRRLDESFLANLGPRQRQTVERYHRMLIEVYDQITTGSQRLDGRTLAERIDAVLGPLPVQIQAIELCRRVRGFGVYEPFDNTTFLSGREHKMIVYLEVDHFTPVEASTGEFEVKLTQEVELYDKDGLMVWRHDPVKIVDRSRNQRRDFFTVQMIALPARLTVGTFHLKVRLADENGQSRTERTIDLDIVADQALVVGK